MALYAFDGTGNQDNPGADKDSNVLLFFEGYNDPQKSQEGKNKTGSVYYKGIGRRAHTFVGLAIAEAFGIGGHERVHDALDQLDRNFAAGDTVIDVVGFSRGAALAISFANKLAKTHAERSIRFIGVWDIVGEFGAPGKRFNAGHDLSFPPNVKRCYHAMALDEHRAIFPLTRISSGKPENAADEAKRLVEVWFRGVHSDVGGGNGNEGMNWIALNWMFENAVREQLPINPADIASNLTRATKPIKEEKFEVGPMRDIRDTDLLHASVQVDKGDPLHPRNNPKVALARIDDSGKVTAAGA